MGRIGKGLWIAVIVVALIAAAFAKSVLLIALAIVVAIAGGFLARRG